MAYTTSFSGIQYYDWDIALGTVKLSDYPNVYVANHISKYIAESPLAHFSLSGGPMAILTDLPAMLAFDPEKYPDRGLIFMIVQMQQLKDGYIASGYAAQAPDDVVALERAIAASKTTIERRAKRILVERAAALEAEYQKLYEQVHPKRKLEDVKRELEAVQEMLDAKG